MFLAVSVGAALALFNLIGTFGAGDSATPTTRAASCSGST